MMGEVLQHPQVVVVGLYEAFVAADQLARKEPTEENIAAKNRAWRLWHQAAFNPKRAAR
jgi:hypothetical protein